MVGHNHDGVWRRGSQGWGVPCLRRSFIMRGPSQIERGGGAGIAARARPACGPQATGQDAGVPDASRGASIGTGRRGRASERAGMALAVWCTRRPAQEPLRASALTGQMVVSPIRCPLGVREEQ